MLTLTNFNFDSNSGWTGKGLKFDGVNDNCSSTLDGANNKYLELTYSGGKRGGFIFDGRNEMVSYFNQNGNGNLEISGVSMVDSEFYISHPVHSTKSETTGLKQMVSGNPLKIIGKIAIRDEYYTNATFHSIKIYNVVLTLEEIQQNYEYEQSIDRTSVQMLPDNSHDLSYGIGDSAQLSEEQKATFRLSVDGTRFVAGLRYCEGLEVEEYTYSEIQFEMEKEEWASKEELE